MLGIYSRKLNWRRGVVAYSPPGRHKNDIHYDAKGQRQAIWYGNGTKTGYTYDAQTFRLRRLLTVKLSTNEILQDLNYWYDPVGNITQINDDAQQTLFYANTIIDPTQKFTYDALYRLTEAGGREQIGTADFGAEDNYNDTAWMVNLGSDAAQLYVQQYSYDETGNILELKHIANAGSYTREYNYSSTNKLVTTEVGSWLYTYGYDVRGNMTGMPHLSSMVWNAVNELSSVIAGSNTTYYQYSGGQRTRKYTDKGIVKEERIYLGSYEIYRKFDSTGSLKLIERTTVHVSDDTGRIAMLEERTFGNAADDNNTAVLLTRYIYSNHLQSASLELNEVADIISYEEYHPYGTTAYQATSATINAVSKRYRYTGRERDEESGLYYHGARYYVPWLWRWCSPDPINSEWYNIEKGNPERNNARHFLELSASPYEYCLDNPVKHNDPTGEQEVDARVKHNIEIDPATLDKIKTIPIAEERIAEGGVEKVTEKAVEKQTKTTSGKTILKGIVKIGPKLNIIVDTIQATIGPADMIPGAGDMSQYRRLAAEQEKIKSEFADAAKRIETGVSTPEEEQKKNKYLIFVRCKLPVGNG